MRYGLLIVEDEVELLDLLVEIFGSEGWDVFYAENGKRALEMWRDLKKANSIDCILCDLTMPKLPGAEFVRQIRSQNDMTPVVVLSGFRHADVATSLEGLGIFDFIDKPFHHQYLTSCVTRAAQIGRELIQTQMLLDSVAAGVAVGKRIELQKKYQDLLLESARYHGS
jgi:DNA-binding NtrC family response regulator